MVLCCGVWGFFLFFLWWWVFLSEYKSFEGRDECLHILQKGVQNKEGESCLVSKEDVRMCRQRRKCSIQRNTGAVSWCPFKQQLRSLLLIHLADFVIFAF